VNITSAVFDCSSPDLDSCPAESLPEFAFIGRSNVGKSSLVNMLAQKPDMARVSPVPGFTKLINFFTINNSWYLVDLPGYGFAQVAQKDSSRFNKSVADYLQNRPTLCCVFALIDSSLPPQSIDLEFVEWLTRNSIPYVLVFTKADKQGSTKVQKNIDDFMKCISKWFAQPPAYYKCSAQTKQGRDELLGVIEQTLKDIVAQEKTKTTQPQKMSVRQLHKKRSDLTRPW